MSGVACAGVQVCACWTGLDPSLLVACLAADVSMVDVVEAGLLVGGAPAMSMSQAVFILSHTTMLLNEICRGTVLVAAPLLAALLLWPHTTCADHPCRSLGPRLLHGARGSKPSILAPNLALKVRLDGTRTGERRPNGKEEWPSSPSGASSGAGS